MQQPVSKLPNTIAIPQFPPPHHTLCDHPPRLLPCQALLLCLPNSNLCPLQRYRCWLCPYYSTQLNSKLPFLQALQTFPCSLFPHHTFAALLPLLPHAFTPQSTCASPRAHSPRREGIKLGKTPPTTRVALPHAVFTPLCPAGPGRATGSEKRPERRRCWQPEQHGSFSRPKR